MNHAALIAFARAHPDQVGHMLYWFAHSMGWDATAAAPDWSARPVLVDAYPPLLEEDVVPAPVFAELQGAWEQGRLDCQTVRGCAAARPQP